MLVKKLKMVMMGCVFASLSSIAIYSSTAMAGENNVCTSTPESCKSGTIIVIPANNATNKQSAAMFCDFNKSIVVDSLMGGIVCVRR
jgi:hypothetical protein